MELVRTRRIIDAEGAEAVLAAAEARARQEGSRVVIAVVDPHGELVAKATLRASADGHLDEEVEIHVANGDVRDLGTIELCAVSTIEGRVLGEAGLPLGDVRVCVLRPPFPQFCERLAAAQHAPSATPATSAAQGTGAFELGGVRRGPAIVWASKPGCVSAWRLLV